MKEIEKEAKEAGLSWATMRRAKDELKLKSERDGYGGPWLVDAQVPPATISVSIYGKNSHF